MREYLIYSQSLENFIIDLSSYIFILIILFLLFLSNYINKKLFIFFSLYSATPFFFNDFLFSSMDMWDQYTNTYHLINFRHSLFANNYFENYFDPDRRDEIKLILGSHFYGIAPFIYIKSINSIAFINKLLLCLTSIYLLRKKYISKSHLFFLLLYPSSLIYSSLSLKELFLAISCVWIFILLYEKKYLFSCLLLLGCFLIRPLFYTFVVFFVLYFFISLRLIKKKYLNFIIFNFLILTFAIFFIQDIIDQFNWYIKTYNQEDAGWGSFLNEENLSYINLSINSVMANLKIIIDKLTLNWPVPTKYKLLFIIENMIIFYFIFKNFLKDYKKNKLQLFVSISFLISAIVCLYIIFPNLLPLHRYLYPYIFFYIFFSKFNLNENHSYNK